MSFDQISDLAVFERRYADLLADDLFDEILLSAQEPNFFRIIGAINQELKHSNFLAWLLSPNESHGLGDYFLKRVLQDLIVDEKSNISILELGSLNLDSAEVRREWKNIDILILLNDFLVCIENKIWSGEGHGQLEKYKKIVDSEFQDNAYKKVFVYLTPYGIESSQKDVYLTYSYQRIVEILEKILSKKHLSITSQISLYISDYLSILKQSIMNDSAIIESAKKLYKNHKEFFDFIFEHKPDYWDDFGQYLRKKLQDRGWIIGSKNKGYARFLPESINDLIPRYSKKNGWPDAEAFLFEFEFYYHDKMTFKTMISPAVDNEDYRNKLVGILNKIPDANTTPSAKWKGHFSKSIKWKGGFENEMVNWNDATEKKVDDFIESVVPIIEKVETGILEHKDELIKLKRALF